MSLFFLALVLFLIFLFFPSSSSFFSFSSFSFPLPFPSPFLLLFHLKGYKTDRGFIIAQSPLRETRRDFWKMVFDREITTLVMLSPVMEGGEVREREGGKRER